MHERDPHELQREQHPGVCEAAQKHWEALADPTGLQGEFASNYLGCWPDKDGFGAELARDGGLPPTGGPALAERLGSSRELAFVPDEHGVHVFVHPVGPDTRQARSVQRLRHLRLVPRLTEDDEATGIDNGAARPRRG